MTRQVAKTRAVNLADDVEDEPPMAEAQPCYICMKATVNMLLATSFVP
jgi:hypothetical protein